jgi:hypothetical protein
MWGEAPGLPEWNAYERLVRGGEHPLAASVQLQRSPLYQQGAIRSAGLGWVWERGRGMGSVDIAGRALGHREQLAHGGGDGSGRDGGEEAVLSR